MKQLNVFIAALVLTCFALFPAISHADGMDDLDVTMTVLDHASDLDVAISEMRGPDAANEVDFDDVDDRESYAGESDRDEDESDGEVASAEDLEDDNDDDFEDDNDDGFDHDDDFDEDDFDDSDDFEDEDDFDEGEDIDEEEIDDNDDDDDDDDDIV